MTEKSVVFIMVFVFLAVAAANGATAQSLSYDTPQYSGQTARFDRGMDYYRDHGNARRAAEQRLHAIQRDRRNDLAVDRHTNWRNLQVRREMERQREDALRAAERQQRLKLND